MTILKFFKNFMFLLEIKRKTPDFPITHTKNLKPQRDFYMEIAKERKKEIEKWLDRHPKCKSVVITYQKLINSYRNYSSFDDGENKLLKT